jgi:hypothetical protein
MTRTIGDVEYTDRVLRQVERRAMWRRFVIDLAILGILGMLAYATWVAVKNPDPRPDRIAPAVAP